MASSTKTQNLQLNKWHGSDKPKKDDFNADNEKIDSVFGGIAQAQQNAANHIADTAQHMAGGERAKWNGKDESVMGTYQGNGNAQRKIELGFAPKFGAVYPIGQTPFLTDVMMEDNKVYSGFFSTLGCSHGISTDTSGFNIVYSASSSPTGITSKLNEPGRNYVYIAWR